MASREAPTRRKVSRRSSLKAAAALTATAPLAQTRDRPVPANDIWIAALALERHLVLHAGDAHFDALPQLPRI
jgi:predicted nucleic acid-binding protein